MYVLTLQQLYFTAIMSATLKLLSPPNRPGTVLNGPPTLFLHLLPSLQNWLQKHTPPFAPLSPFPSSIFFLSNPCVNFFDSGIQSRMRFLFPNQELC